MCVVNMGGYCEKKDVCENLGMVMILWDEIDTLSVGVEKVENFAIF